MSITRDEIRKIIRERMHPRASVDNLLFDYEEFVNTRGHATPAATSVAASFFLERPDLAEDHEAHQIIADEYGMSHEDIMRDMNRQKTEKMMAMSESKKSIRNRLRRIIREEKARLLKEMDRGYGSDYGDAMQDLYQDLEDVFAKAKMANIFPEDIKTVIDDAMSGAGY